MKIIFLLRGLQDMGVCMNNIACKNCGLIDEYTEFESGPHIGARCNGCGSFIKWIPQNKDFVIPFGKHKGRELTSMTSKEELSYLSWVSDQDWCKDGLKNKIQEHLSKQDGKES